MSFNASTFEARLRKVDATQTSIQSMSKYWVLTSAGSDGAPLAGIVKSQAGVFDSVSVHATVEKRLALIFLASDVLHAARRGGPALHAAFCSSLLPPLVRALAISASSTGDGVAAAVTKLTKLVALWRDRQIFPSRDVATLAAALDSPATVIAEQDDVDILLRVCASRADDPKVGSGSDAAAAAAGATTGVGVSEGSQEPMTLRSKSPLSMIEMELATGPVIIDVAAAARATAVGASTDDSFAATETALASVERAEIAVRLALDSATGLKGFADRAIVIEANIALEARTEAFKRSLPFPALAEARRSAVRLCDALGAEKRAREVAVTALSNLLVREEELAGADEAALSLAEAQLEALRSVRRRLAGRRAESAAAARSAAAAAAKAAEPEDGETADARTPVPTPLTSSARVGGLLGRAPQHPSPPAAFPKPVPTASLSASDLVAQVLSSAVQSAGARGGVGGAATAVSSLHSALGVVAPDSYGAVFAPGAAPGFSALAPKNVFIGPDGESRSRLGGPTQLRPRVSPGPGMGSYAPSVLPLGFAGGGGGGILPSPYSPSKSGAVSGWGAMPQAPPPMNPGAGRGVQMTMPAWMKKN